MTDQSPPTSAGAEIPDHEAAAIPVFAPYSPPAGGLGAARDFESATAAAAVVLMLTGSANPWRPFAQP